jgi:hypothetical protein
MALVPLIDNEYITVCYWPDKETIYHTIHKPVSGQKFREALLAGTEALLKYNIYKWLSDDRNNGPIARDDYQWISTVWRPQTIAAGWKYWSVVVPPNPEAAGSLVASIDSLYELGLQMMVFTTIEEAIAWLDSKKPSSLKK